MTKPIERRLTALEHSRRSALVVLVGDKEPPAELPPGARIMRILTGVPRSPDGPP